MQNPKNISGDVPGAEQLREQNSLLRNHIKHKNYFHLIPKLTERSMNASIVWTDDHKLLQKSNLTPRHPRWGAHKVRHLL